MSTDQLAYGRRVIWQGRTAEIIDIDWQRLNAIRVRIRIAHASRSTRWVRADELEAV